MALENASSGELQPAGRAPRAHSALAQEAEALRCVCSQCEGCVINAGRLVVRGEICPCKGCTRPFCGCSLFALWHVVHLVCQITFKCTSLAAVAVGSVTPT